jgi:prepilin-type processing-associated H-X9-DG protein
LRKLTRLELALLGIPIIVIAAPLVSHLRGLNNNWRANPFARARESKRSATCQYHNLSQIAVAFQQYTQDYGGKFPVVKVVGSSASGAVPPSYASPYGWADALQYYLRCEGCYQCPSESTPLSSPTKRGYTDYWFNGNLSGVRKSAVRLPAATFLVGEGSDGTDKTNATYSKSSLPAAWLSNRNSPAFRHMGGANYLFADGHVAWLKPDQVVNSCGRKDCFAVE